MKRMRYFIGRKKNKSLAALVLIVIVLSFIYIINLVNIKLQPVMESVAQAKGTSVAVTIINQAVSQVLQDSFYQDLVIFEKNPKGDITAVTSDIVKVNKLKADLTTEIQSGMTKMDMLDINIPMGTLLNSDLLSGMGPMVNVKLMPLGYVNLDITNSFSAAGINQTKQEISLKVSAGINIIMPMSSTTVVVDTTIPIAQTVIIGNVPERYGELRIEN